MIFFSEFDLANTICLSHDHRKYPPRKFVGEEAAKRIMDVRISINPYFFMCYKSVAYFFIWISLFLYFESTTGVQFSHIKWLIQSHFPLAILLP